MHNYRQLYLVLRLYNNEYNILHTLIPLSISNIKQIYNIS